VKCRQFRHRLDQQGGQRLLLHAGPGRAGRRLQGVLQQARRLVAALRVHTVEPFSRTSDTETGWPTMSSNGIGWSFSATMSSWKPNRRESGRSR